LVSLFILVIPRDSLKEGIVDQAYHRSKMTVSGHKYEASWAQLRVSCGDNKHSNSMIQR
jgi:hypothetical protein